MSMKKLSLLLLLACLAATLIMAATQTKNVQFRMAEIRDTPDYLGDIIGAVTLGQKVMVLETRGSWVRIEANGKTGWLPANALTEKQVRLEGGERDASKIASSGEMAAATKGFTKEVETDFKARHPDISFAWIDKVETIKIPPVERKKFLKDGQLGAAKGGGQ